MSSFRRRRAVARPGYTVYRIQYTSGKKTLAYFSEHQQSFENAGKVVVVLKSEVVFAAKYSPPLGGGRERGSRRVHAIWASLFLHRKTEG